MTCSVNTDKSKGLILRLIVWNKKLVVFLITNNISLDYDEHFKLFIKYVRLLVDRGRHKNRPLGAPTINIIINITSNVKKKKKTQFSNQVKAMLHMRFAQIGSIYACFKKYVRKKTYY